MFLQEGRSPLRCSSGGACDAGQDGGDLLGQQRLPLTVGVSGTNRVTSSHSLLLLCECGNQLQDWIEPVGAPEGLK